MLLGRYSKYIHKKYKVLHKMHKWEDLLTIGVLNQLKNLKIFESYSETVCAEVFVKFAE